MGGLHTRCIIDEVHLVYVRGRNKMRYEVQSCTLKHGMHGEQIISRVALRSLKVDRVLGKQAAHPPKSAHAPEKRFNPLAYKWDSQHQRWLTPLGQPRVLDYHRPGRPFRRPVRKRVHRKEGVQYY